MKKKTGNGKCKGCGTAIKVSSCYCSECVILNRWLGKGWKETWRVVTGVSEVWPIRQ